MSAGNRALAANALLRLRGEIEKPDGPGKPVRFDEVEAGFKGACSGGVVVRSGGSLLTFEIGKNILLPNEVAGFNDILWRYGMVCPADARVAFDLRWESRLSYFAVGAIIGSFGAAKKALLRPPDDMYLMFKRLRFEEFGIQVRNSPGECRW